MQLKIKRSNPDGRYMSVVIRVISSRESEHIRKTRKQLLRVNFSNKKYTYNLMIPFAEIDMKN